MTENMHVLPQIDGNIFTVVVGTGETVKSFVLHRNVACARSEFFRACLGGDWKESVDARVELPEDDPEIFQLYTQSLYTDNMRQPDFGHPTAIYKSTRGSLEINRTRYRFLTDLYILSDKMVDVRAKDHAIKLISDLLSRDIVKLSGHISEELVEMITTIWDVTLVDAPIRDLLVNSVVDSVANVSEGLHEKLKCLSDAPPDFLVSVIEASAKSHLSGRWYSDKYVRSITPAPDEGMYGLRPDLDNSWGT